MSFVLALLLVVVGLLAAIWGSRVAVKRAASLAAGSRIPPFFIGITLVALGTDLPEIATSVVSAVTDHGDLLAGDAIGSTVTQVTLILGLLPFLVGAFAVGRRSIGSVVVATIVCLGVGVVLLADGFLSRSDGVVLIAVWVAASAAVWRFLPKVGESELPLGGGVIRRVLGAFGGLLAVGVGAMAAVEGFVTIAEALSIPEYLVSFFGASIGTSLPELVVDITAVRRGNRDLAIGDAFGSSLVDASLSLGIGPAVAPVAVTASLAVRGSLAAMGVIGLVGLLLSIRERLDWKSGLTLLVIYAAFYPLMLAA